MRIALYEFSGRKPWREGVIEKEGKTKPNEDHAAQHVAPVHRDGGGVHVVVDGNNSGGGDDGGVHGGDG